MINLQILFIGTSNLIGRTNRLVGSLKSMYTALTLKGYYLPKFNSPCITSDYLLGVALKKVFVCMSSDIRTSYLISKATKIDLFRDFSHIVGQEQDIGFTSEKLPNREQLINVLRFVSPHHFYFKEPSTNQLSNLTQQNILKLKEVNTSLFRTKRLRFFKTTKEQRHKRAVNNLKGQIEKVKTYIEEDSIKHTNIIGKLQKLKRKLNETQSIQLEGNIEIRNSTIFEQSFQPQYIIKVLNKINYFNAYKFTGQIYDQQYCLISRIFFKIKHQKLIYKNAAWKKQYQVIKFQMKIYNCYPVFLIHMEFNQFLNVVQCIIRFYCIFVRVCYNVCNLRHVQRIQNITIKEKNRSVRTNIGYEIFRESKSLTIFRGIKNGCQYYRKCSKIVYEDLSIKLKMIFCKNKSVK